MTRIRIDDLPLAVRRKIAEGTDRGAPRSPEAPVGSRRPPQRPSTYRCATCDAEIEGFGRAQRHANDEHHGARLELLLRQHEPGYGGRAQPH